MKRVKAPKLRDSTVTNQVVRRALARGAKRGVKNIAAASQPVAIVKIGWDGTVERLRLDLATLREGERLTTQDWWIAEKENVTYRPRIVAYSVSGKGAHVLELLYVRSEHPDLLDETGILWGTTRLRLSADLRTASARWFTDPPSERWDGPARSCRVHIEQPSRVTQALKDVRVAQAAFKESVLRFGDCCALTKERTRAALDAAHVHDVGDGGSDEPENGLLLRADLHRLFDSGYFSINPDGRLALHRKLSEDYAKKLRKKRLGRDILRRITPYLEKRRPRDPVD